ncbi:MAG: hypothetical protein IJ343_02745 [Clostridia bacterium]|nr:hypothetical protein [Clostridia bacterium]
MTQMIQSRRGAILYVVSAPLLAAALSLIPLSIPVNPPAHIGLNMDAAVFRTVLTALAIWMGFALSAWVLLAVRVVRKAPEKGYGRCIPMALLMWFPAAVCAPGIYVWSLVRLLRGGYPDLPWRTSLLRVMLPAVLLAGIFLIAAAVNHARMSAPAPTPEKAFQPSDKNPQVLAKLPREDGSLLMIGLGECGVVRQTTGGWVLQEVYETSYQRLTGDERSAQAFISRSRSDDVDVVVVWKVAFQGDETGRAALPPRDSAGSDFAAVVTANAVVTEYFYYTLVDADVSGYTLWYE